jgi:anti-sigma regulatory factor (Ser/Thr protein kinase)
MIETRADIARWTLPATAAAVTRGRERVRGRVERLGDESLAAAAELMTAELVANVVRHVGSGKMLVELEIGDEVIVRVADGGPGFDAPSRPAPGTIGGWGLVIVDELSDRWGIDRDPTVVWFALERD